MYIRVQLYRAQRRRLKRLLRKTRSRIEALRARVLLLLDEGDAVELVSCLAGCVRATVYRTVYRFEDLGEDGLLDRRKVRPPRKVTPEVEARLLGYLDRVPRDFGWQRSTWTLELLSLQLDHDCGVRLSPSHVRNLLRRHGCRRGRPRVGLRIPVRGRRAVLERIAARVAAADPSAEVFYQDEADVDLNPRIGLAYIKRGHQPIVLTPGKNVKRYVAGALNARTGAIVHVESERKDSAQFIALIEAVRRRYRRSRTLHFVLDNCITHKSRRTLAYLASLGERVVLHFLPPYSPEANVIERLWKQLHDHVTRNHRFTTIEALMTAVREFLACAQPFPGTKVSTARAA